MVFLTHNRPPDKKFSTVALEERVDVFIGNHMWNNDTERKGKVLLQTVENQFADDKIFGQFLDFCEKRLERIIQEGR